MQIHKTLRRRRFLHGMLGASAVMVGLPVFDCLLNEHGTALANGQPLPVRFGTWFWSLGMNEQVWVPDKVGEHYDLKLELAALASVKEHVNIFSRFRTEFNGRTPIVHYTGWVVLRCGDTPASDTDLPGESIDVTIADAIGGTTRFPSLEMAATGNKRDSYSFRGKSAINPPEATPVDLYQRVFGAEFQDPNSPVFKPDPKIMLRKSVLSGVREEGASLRRTLGAADRQRLDAYFTSLREMERRLELQLQKPPPIPACHATTPPPEIPVGMDVELINERHQLMTDILVMALTCNQTRVFNMVYSNAPAGTGKKGLPSTHHITSHEEGNNKEGYQEMHSWFIRQAMGSWAYFVGALASVREGDRTLLDNTLVYAHSEHDYARFHTFNGVPMMTAGRAGGRIKTGLHVDGRHEALASRLGLTLLRGMGLATEAWGKGALRTTETISEILA